ncbi:D-alanine--D-alanine ligase [Helicobacter sp.]|uniref:D-alanine--D-alanine ligase n=1 Tax=Helicobacter sp. TaxID=218 RepID=UPI0025BA6A1F|nr:D-alanine--D-alanine ligase [Helicobacter sp.]MBR2494658.1 D-alanine--D-alanine ligase [Helicobacter sp.]
MSKVSVLFGGTSFEHEISIVSAISLKKVLGDNIAHFIFLDGGHHLYLIPADKMQAKIFATGEYKQCKQLEWILGGLCYKGLFGSKRLNNVGVVLSLIHGGDGEDGVVSSVLEFYKLPFIAPRVAACTLSFNKILTKNYAVHIGVKTLPYEYYRYGDEVHCSFAYPFIVKPATLGSSIGVSVVEQQSDVEYALDSAFSYDREILIEPFYKSVREYNLAGYKNAQGEMVFSMVEEPKKTELLSFDDKYLDFSRTTQTRQANIDKELESKLQESFRRIYGDIFVGALIRCDFFVIDGEIYLNEINPIPGSMAHYLFENFPSHIQALSQALPRSKPIKITYNYVQKIRAAKGK